MVSDDDIVAAYRAHGNVYKAAEAVGVAHSTVHRRLVKLGIARSRRHFSDEEVARLKRDYNAYVGAGRLVELAAEMGRSKTTLCRMAGQLGLTDPRRPVAPAHLPALRAASANRWKRNPHPRGALGLKHGDEAKRVISEKSLASWVRFKESGTGLMAPEALQERSDKASVRMNTFPAERMYSRAAAGRRDDLGDTYWRSKWEANYARYLNWLQARGVIEAWSYEPTTFWFEKIKRGVRSYKPDFLICENGKSYFVEVKGWMDAKSMTKLKRMAKYYPEVDLRLVGKAEYEAIRRSASQLIEGWER